MAYLDPTPRTQTSRSTTVDVLRRSSAIPPNPHDLPGKVAISDEFWVLEISSPQQIGSVTADWDNLVANAAQPNVFYERWAFEPAWRAFADDANTSSQVHVLMVFHRGKATQFPPVPIGLFACSVEHDLGRSAGPVLTLWRHLYHFDSTPILRHGWTVAAVDTFFRWAAMKHPDCQLVRMTDIAADGPVAMALTEWQRTSEVTSFELDRFNRAMMEPHSNADAYLEHSVSPSTRRELRRQSRRFHELGDVQITTTVESTDIENWIERFLELESRGWKESTALAAQASHAAYFRELIANAAESGQFEGLDMTLDGKSIAMKCNFYSTPCGQTEKNRRAVAFKIAYDESFSKFSPGMLLELEMIRQFHTSQRATAIDSCAKPGHPMIDRMWSERTHRLDVVYALGGWRATLFVGLRQFRRLLRRAIRRQRPEVPRTNF